MRSWVMVAFILFLMLFGGARVFNSLLYHDQATVLVISDYCELIDGEKIDGYCKITADVSYRLLSGNRVIRTQSGEIYELPAEAVISMAWKESHYGFSWD